MVTFIVRPKMISLSSIIKKFHRAQSRTGPDPETHAEAPRPECLCTVVRPLLRLVQLFGILPLTDKQETHQLSHIWLSPAAYLNYGWILIVAIGAVWLRSRLQAVTEQVITGTDFYTINITFVTNIIAIIGVYISSTFGGARFCSRGWEQMHASFQELNLPNYKLVRRVGILVPILLLEELIADIAMSLIGYWNDDMEIEGIGFLFSMTSFILNFVPNIICGSFAVLAWIIAIQFKTINTRVETIMKEVCAAAAPQVTNLAIDVVAIAKIANANGNAKCVHVHDHGHDFSSKASPGKMSRLRLLHENTCDVVTKLEQAFGVQILIVFCSTGLFFVTGIYSLIVTANGLLSTKKLEAVTYAYCTSSILSSVRIIVVLVMCEYLMFKANETGKILNRYDMDSCSSDEMKMQVKEFKDKVGLFPLRLTCCCVFPLSTTVLAPAAANIATYVLVLMQFKLASRDG